MMSLHSLRASCASVYRFAHALFIDPAANANDHENDLQCLRMIVKNDSQCSDLTRPQETGGVCELRLAMYAHDDRNDAFKRTLRRL